MLDGFKKGFGTTMGVLVAFIVANVAFGAAKKETENKEDSKEE